jgi:hypothetical protein
MLIYQKLNDARGQFHGLKLTKSGENEYAKYKYFELGDFLLPGMQAFSEHGLCAFVSFTADTASMRIVAIEDGSEITITSPMGSAALKGCHEVQNIGAVETYQRRYLWVAALEIVEHDALDATTGKGEIATKQREAPKPDWPDGPCKNITGLKAAARTLWREIDGAPDADSLDALLNSERPLLKQIQLAWHEGWNGDGHDNIGFGALIAQRQTRRAAEAASEVDPFPIAGSEYVNAG